MAVTYRVEVAFFIDLSGLWQLGISTLGINTVLAGGIGAGASFQEIFGVESISLAHGRPTELDVCEAGTCEVNLENMDDRYTNSNTLGPYYGYLVPMKQMRVIATFDGVDYQLFRGFIERWEPDLMARTCKVTAVDAFNILTSQMLTMSFDTQTTGPRIARVLDAINWDYTMRALDVGQDTVVGSSIEAKSALQEIQDLAQAERGLFFMDGRGYAVYQSRSYRSNTTASMWFTPDDYINLTMNTANESIYNQVIDSDGTVLASDETSMNAYGVRTLNLPPDYVPVGQKTLLAGYLVSLYKDPHNRLEMSVRPDTRQDTATLFGLDLSSRLNVIRPDSGLDADFWIEHVSHEISNNLTDHIITYTLSHVDNLEYWVLGVSTLGVSTRVGY